jgi:hypothetical protein
MAKAPPVPAAIMQHTKNLRTREAMMVGSHMEGGWYPPFPVGDQGTSFGPYQMHEGGALTAAGLSPSQAEDPNTATKAMLGAYTGAVNQISEQLWSSNPEKAAEESAFLAEKPAVDYYSSQGASAVNSAWTDTQDVLSGRKSSGGMPTGPATPATLTSTSPDSAGSWWQAILEGPQGIIQYAAQKAAGSVTGQGNTVSMLTRIYNILSDPVDVLERGALIVFGATVIIVGLVVLGSGSRTARTAVNAASRGASSRISGTVSGASSDRAQRLQLAQEANKIGERKLALKEQREQRLSGRQNVQRPAVGKHRRVEAA